MSSNTTLLLTIAIVLIILSMLFSASESAFFSVNKLRVRFLRNQKHKGAVRAGKLLDNKSKLLNTVLVGNNIVNIALSAILTSIALDFFGPAGVGYATFATTILLLIFGEITPKTLGTQHPESIAFALSRFLNFFAIIFQPFILFFSAISVGIIKVLGIKTGDKQVSFTEEEIKTLIEVGEEEGLLEESERHMMHRVFMFTDLAARDIMTPRTDITFIEETATYEDVLKLAKSSKLSRFPVQGKNIDDIKGVLYIKDVLAYISDKDSFTIKKTMREPLYISETKNMTSIQQLFKSKTQSIAIVLDEYSGVAGILTKEDIAREIFGVVNDEYEAPVENIHVIMTDSELMVSGKTRLSEISEQFGITLESEFHETIAGLIMEVIDRIPQEGDLITKEGFSFTVKTLDGIRISKVLIKAEDV